MDISNGLDCGSVVSIADDLGGASMAYLSINNKITWRNPVDDFGNSLPDYWKNLPQWKEYRANLMEMITRRTRNNSASPAPSGESQKGLFVCLRIGWRESIRILLHQKDRQLFAHCDQSTV